MKVKTGLRKAGSLGLILGVAGLVCGLWAPASGRAQFVPPGTVSALSHSGQFVVYGHRFADPPWPLSTLLTNRLYVGLEPTLVTISAERVKQALLRNLETTDTWRGKVYLVLHPAQTDNDMITITSEKFKDTWRYRVDLPDLVERRRYVRVLVQVLLLEMANRGATDHSAEIPPWLAEGLAQDLLTASEAEIILAPPGRTVNGVTLSSTQFNTRKQHPLGRAQRVLRANTPLTFQELSWPADAPPSSTAQLVYACSAQVFVHELVHLPNGRANLRVLIGQLPKYYNWQLALLHAFRPQFERPLDVEKWWALRLAQFTGETLGDTWSVAESRQRLEEALRLPVEVRTATNELPLHAEVTLQTILKDWAPAQRTQALQGRLRHLQLLRRHIAPELGTLVDEYSQTLEAYLRPPLTGKRSLVFPFRKKKPQPPSVQDTVKRLNACDARLAKLQPAAKPADKVLSQADGQPRQRR